MVRTNTQREEELIKIIEPYFVFDGIGYGSRCPRRSKKALQELRELGEQHIRIENL